MTRYSSSALPWFAVPVLVFLVGVIAFGGTAEAVLVAVGSFAFLGAAIRFIGLTVRENPVSARMLTNTDVVHGSILSEAAKARSGRSR